ncbi:MAG: hypothetical protein WCG31_03180 [Deltaproteobacteria bacterium]
MKKYTGTFLYHFFNIAHFSQLENRKPSRDRLGRLKRHRWTIALTIGSGRKEWSLKELTHICNSLILHSTLREELPLRD